MLDICEKTTAPQTAVKSLMNRKHNQTGIAYDDKDDAEFCLVVVAAVVATVVVVLEAVVVVVATVVDVVAGVVDDVVVVDDAFAIEIVTKFPVLSPQVS